MRKQLSKYDIRLEILKNNQEKFKSHTLSINLPKKLLNNLTGSFDNLQNDPILTSAFKESIFIARELIDIIIHNLAYQFKGTVANDFSKFIISLANGRYSKLDSPCILYLSNPNVINWIIKIRLMRNKMKKELDLTFLCINQHDLEIHYDVPLDSKLRENIPNFDELMDIENRELCDETTKINAILLIINPNDFLKGLLSIFQDLKDVCAIK